MSRSLVDIQADLDFAYAARRKALEAEEYSFDSGQGRQSAKRSLVNINKTIAELTREYDDSASSGEGVVSINFQRGIL